jgi:hydroxymethylglutaryl-CoA synthase
MSNVGILAMDCYFPHRFVPQTLLEEADGCPGKYTVGLGQTALAFFDDREDVASIMLTVCLQLLEKYGVPPSAVGRLEVGTETLIDKSKSVKTTLMHHLFGGNSDVEGVTSTNACYGGTAALLNSVAWVESSAWDGRYALVVCGDIAVYAPGPARPTGGGGAVAMLVGPDAPLPLAGPRATHAFEVYDFYKPRGDTEYAIVDGKLSQEAYLTSVDMCWARLKSKLVPAAARAQVGLPPHGAIDLSCFDYVCMHSPYNKLVQKGFARLVYGDFFADPASPRFEGELQIWAGKPPAETVSDRDVEKCFVTVSKPDFAAKCRPTDTASRQVGNCYTAAVYMNLLSVVCGQGKGLEGKRLLLFSYGSGAVATAFVISARAPAGDARLASPPSQPFTLERIAATVKLTERLHGRAASDLAALNLALDQREATYGSCGYEPAGPIEALAPGTFYLKSVDELHRRSYGRA